jgi:hypothetical protein
MRVAAGVAVTLGMLAGPMLAAAADIYLIRDRQGVLHLTNTPVDPGSKLVIRQPPRVPFPRVLTLEPMGPIGPRLPPLVVPPGGPSAYDTLIRIIADRYDVEYALVKAVIKAESGFNNLAVSRKGAQGLMQLMPETAAEHQVQDSFLPQDNIDGGVRYLRRLLDRYGGNLVLALAAYNAGPARVDEAGGVPDIAETREYLTRVLRYRLGYLRESAGVREARR